MPAPTLCLMLKAPRLGQVKTRLAKDIGEAAALAAYRALVERQMREIPAGWNVEIHFTPDDGAAEMRAWLGPLREAAPVFIPQAAGDLGARLIAALHSAFARGARQVIFVGGDCPGLTRERLAEAAEKLEHADLVIIPAVDGGYVSIAFNVPHTGVFEGIEWSTERVCEQTQRRAKELRLSFGLLAPLEDVDELASWERAQRLLEG